MLRITVRQNADSTTLRIEGRLIGPWVQELRTIWTNVRSAPGPDRVVINLTDITIVDAHGRSLLAEISSAGAVLTGSGLLAKALIADVTVTPMTTD